MDAPQIYGSCLQEVASAYLFGLFKLNSSLFFIQLLIIVYVGWIIFIIFENFIEWLKNYSKQKKVARGFTHSNDVEIMWTSIPALFLSILAYPSFSLLNSTEGPTETAYSIKVSGYQWYWGYENIYNSRTKRKLSWLICQMFLTVGQAITRYSCYCFEPMSTDRDHNFRPRSKKFFIMRLKSSSMFYFSLIGKFSWIRHAEITGLGLLNIYKCKINDLHYAYADSLSYSLKFSSYILGEEGFENCRLEGYLRNLEAYKRLLIPKSLKVRILVSSSDVLHSWTVPSFGVKVDACPARLNQAFLFAKRAGTFYGQCSEICGMNHAFMPIAVMVIDVNKFAAILKINNY